MIQYDQLNCSLNCPVTRSLLPIQFHPSENVDYLVPFNGWNIYKYWILSKLSVHIILN